MGISIKIITRYSAFDKWIASNCQRDDGFET